MTLDLILNLQKMAKKTFDILFCKKPVLFCVLTAEFLKGLSNQAYQFKGKCEKTSIMFIVLANHIIAKIKEEEDLRYFLLHKDSQNRSVLSIIEANNFKDMLENNDIGTIIEKL